MPIYEYACTSCGHEDDLIQKASDRPKRKCPACGRMTFKRKISTPNFRLKGTGWYETDFKNKDKGKAAKDGESEKSGKGDDKSSPPEKKGADGTSSSDKKTESKPASSSTAA